MCGWNINGDKEISVLTVRQYPNINQYLFPPPPFSKLLPNIPFFYGRRWPAPKVTSWRTRFCWSHWTKPRRAPWLLQSRSKMHTEYRLRWIRWVAAWLLQNEFIYCRLCFKIMIRIKAKQGKFCRTISRKKTLVSLKRWLEVKKLRFHSFTVGALNMVVFQIL